LAHKPFLHHAIFLHLSKTKALPFLNGDTMRVGLKYSFLYFFFEISSEGQFNLGEERERISHAIPPDSIRKVKEENKRTIVVKLLPNGPQERKLKQLTEITTIL
jgi:hypothetical protein